MNVGYAITWGAIAFFVGLWLQSNDWTVLAWIAYIFLALCIFSIFGSRF